MGQVRQNSVQIDGQTDKVKLIMPQIVIHTIIFLSLIVVQS